MNIHRSVELERAPLSAEPRESSHPIEPPPSVPSPSPGGRGTGRRLATVVLALALAAAAIASLVPGFLEGGESPAGPPTPTWVAVIGTASRETGRAVVVTSDGVYVAGETTGTFTGQARRPVEGPANDSDVYVARVGLDGRTAWVSQMSIAGNQEATAVAAGQGNAFAVGATRRSQLVGLRPPGVIAAFDSRGTERWRRSLTGVPYGVATDATGVYVTGIDYPSGPPVSTLGDDVRGKPTLWKIGFDGTRLWVKPLASGAFVNDIAVVATGSGRVCTAGTIDGVGGSFVALYASSGRAAFTGESLTDPEERPAPFLIACDGAGVFVGGLIIGEVAPIAAFVQKYAPNGDQRWARRVSGDRLVGMGSDASGAYIGVLSRRDSLRPRVFVVTKLEQDGTVSWSRVVGEVSEFTASVSGIAIAPAAMYVAGTGPLPGGRGERVGDAFVAKFPSDLAAKSVPPSAGASFSWLYLLVWAGVLGAAAIVGRSAWHRRRQSSRR